MMEMKLLENKNVIVTGTSRGMGKKMVEMFAQHGANVFAHARKDTEEHREFCRKVTDENGVQVIPVYFELTEPEQIKEGVKKIRETQLAIDGLVNNAGVIYNALFQMTDMTELRKLFEVNFFAPYLFTQYVLKLMVRNKKGSIVNVSSVAALDGNAGKSAYGASKAAFLCMTLSIAEELGTQGIRANIICPGATETEMLDTMSENILDIQKEASFLKKMGNTKDIAGTALYLLSDYSSYITGQVFRVDGGITEYDKR